MPVAVLSAMTLGLSVDFAIHYLERSRTAYARSNQNWEAAAGEMFGEPGRAISRNILVIAMGFTPLLIAPLVPYQTVGFFLASIMIVSGLATLILLPALVKHLDRHLFKTPALGTKFCNPASCAASSGVVILIITYGIQQFGPASWKPVIWAVAAGIIAAGDKRTSFVGSNFFYEDVSGRDPDEDQHEIDRVTDKFFVLKNTPKNPQDVEFSRYVLWIDRANFLPMKAEYYDKNGKKYRVVEALEVKIIQGHPTVTQARVTDLNTGGKTVSIFNVGLQYNLEHRIGHGRFIANLPAGAFPKDENRHVTTVRLTWLVYQQNVRISLFTFYSPSDGDAHLRPSVLYKITDSWTATLGANIFAGPSQKTFFGQLVDNNNIYARVRYSY
ncbi:MAG: outer membrane lipoprotein-sorting protein [Nitrospinaceae bacterium]